jgi:hypothetical protein
MQETEKVSRPIPPALFAMKSWRIKKQGNKFFIAPTAAFDDRVKWSKPYATLQRACTAIARHMADEWRERNERRRRHYGLKEDMQ